MAWDTAANIIETSQIRDQYCEFRPLPPKMGFESCHGGTCLLACLVRREITAAPAATLWAYLAPKPRARDLHHPERLIECRMGDIVNLRRARKKAERQLAERTAAVNRLQHGRSKAERELEAKRDVKARRDLDRHRIETGDEG
jgi:hypothetical protein